MTYSIREIDDVTFDGAVGSGVALVDFWAPWCGPCRMQTPILQQVAEKIDGKAIVAKLNVDDSASTAERFGIRSIPTLIVFKNGEPVEQFVGVRREQELVDAMEKALRN